MDSAGVLSGESAVGPDPEGAIRFKRDVFNQRNRKPVLLGIPPESTPIELEDAIFGASPDKALRVGRQAPHDGIGEPLVGTIHLETETPRAYIRRRARLDRESRQQPQNRDQAAECLCELGVHQCGINTIRVEYS
jgi:hypothetical protein